MTTATIIPPLTNKPPSRANPAAFPTDGDSFLNDLPGVVSGVNTVATELNTWNAEVETFKNQASSSQTNAANSSATSLTQARNAAASMVSLWVSGTTYSAGQIVYSNVDGREYKRITAGAGTTDPSSDTINWEPLGWEYITNYPDIRPTLDLNFAGSQTVDPRITFTRNSIATYFDKFGVMQTAGVNQPRIDYDPVTGECKGLLIEGQRTNLLTYSEQFDNAVWTKSIVTVSANAVIAPDGTISADKLVATTTANQHSLVSTDVAAGTYTWSVYMKAGELTRGVLSCYDGTSYKVGTVFDLSAGTVVSQQAGSTSTITSVGNGWYRCTVTATLAASSQFGGFQIRPNLGGQFGENAPGNGFSGIYIWGAQLEAGSFPTSYIPTTVAQVTRAADSASMTGTNFSSWYRQGEGSYLLEFSIIGASLEDRVHCTLAETGAHDVFSSISSRNYNLSFVTAIYSGSTLQATAGSFNIAPHSKLKTSVGFKSDSCIGATQGVLSVQDNTVQLPTPSALRFPSTGCNHISRFVHYPKRLPNQVLQAITQP